MKLTNSYQRATDRRRLASLTQHTAEQKREIKTLRRFLSIAVDCHDDEFGEINADENPKHWIIQARKLLVDI